MSTTISSYHDFIGHPQSGQYKNSLCEFSILTYWFSLSVTPGGSKQIASLLDVILNIQHLWS